MLNTIYEEFDFESKIKDLKNKKIKIKRVIKSVQPYSQQSIELNQSVLNQSQASQQQQQLAESMHAQQQFPQHQNEEHKFQSYLSQQQQQSTKIASVNEQLQDLKKIQRDREKKNNPMFYSSIVNTGMSGLGSVNRFSVQNQQNVSQTNQQMMTNNQQQIAPQLQSQYQQQQRLIFEDPRQKEKMSNPMYKSTIEYMMGRQSMRGSSFQNIGKDFEEFMLPKFVTKILTEQDINIQKLSNIIQIEKQKIDNDINQCIKDCVEQFEISRQKLHTKFDQYLDMFQKNYDNLKNRVKLFKEQSIIKPENRNSIYHRQTTTTLKGVSYYGKEVGQYDSLQKYKDEKCSVLATIDKIDREVNKKLINYLSDELTKQQVHIPLYNHSETSQQILTEIKANIANYLSDNLQNLNHLVFMTAQVDFATFAAVPQISTLVSEDNVSAIGDFKSLKNFNAGVIQKYKTDHTDAILCIAVIDQHQVATGSKDTTIKIWNVLLNRQIDTLEGHFDPVTALKTIKAFPKDFSGEQNVLKQLLTKQQENESTYLVSASEQQIIIWDLLQKKQIRSLEVTHTSQITCLLTLKDRQTIISSSKDSTINIWDCNMGVQVGKLTEHTGSVNCMILTKNYEKLISASSDKTFKTWKIYYTFSMKLQKNVFTNIELEKTIQDSCFIFSLNSCHLDQNLIFTGGSDCKIKLWNLQTGQCETEILGHKSPVSEIILFENPFEYEEKKNFILISSGLTDDFLRVSTSLASFNNGLVIDQRIKCEANSFTNPTIQVLKDFSDDSVQLAVVSQPVFNQEEHFFLIIKIR